MSHFVRDPGDISALQADFASGASDPVDIVHRPSVTCAHVRRAVAAYGEDGTVAIARSTGCAMARRGI